MKAITDLISNNSSTLISSLSNLGFSQEQAEQFLPEAGKNIMTQLTEGNIDTESILKNIDVAAIAEKTGIDPSLAASGVTSLIPDLLAKFKENGVSSILGKVGSFFK